MDEMKKRRLDRALGEINHMQDRAPASEELRSEERRRFLEISGTFGFTAAMVAAGAGTLLLPRKRPRRPRRKSASARRPPNTRSRWRPSTASARPGRIR